MKRSDAKMIAELLGDEEYEVTLDPRAKHLAVMVILMIASWAAAITLIYRLLR